MSLNLSNTQIHCFTVISLILVAIIDYITGIEIRAFPLYFLPLMLSAWRLGTFVTIDYAIAASSLWALIMYVSGREYASNFIWLINFLTQSFTFIFVSVLIAMLRDKFDNERTLNRTDLLTGMPNRRNFFEESELLIAQCQKLSQPIALAYIDLDNFKQANDQLGHNYGDKLLQAVAETLKNNLEKRDTCARMGGDEFVILLANIDITQATNLLDRIRDQLAENPILARCHVTASIGAVAYAHSPPMIDEMLRNADSVMYAIKADSKNGVRVESRNHHQNHSHKEASC